MDATPRRSDVPPDRTLITPLDSRRTSGWSLGATIDLPPDLLAEATRRLRAVALLFSVTFLMIGVVPGLVSGEAARFLWSWPARWIPSVSSILLGVVVWGLTFVPNVPPQALVAVSGLFAIAGSYCIAFTEYQGFTTGLTQLVPAAEVGRFYERLGGFGLSWVSLFVVLVSVVVPTPPRRAALNAAIAVTAVPVAFGVDLLTGNVTVAITPVEFFFFLVFPYVWVIAVAYFGARVVYGLGAAVRKAREMGSYRLIERLGAGGMGEVWRADHRLLARPAAIKLVRPETLGGLNLDGRRILMKRFEREAQATAALQSPHTVQVFDFGISNEGAFYYVMELLDGLDADTLVRRFGPMPPERVVHVLRQACASLAEAHGQGLVHRDIKPANIYLCRYARETDFVKVLDFGLVKSPAERGVAETGLTAENAISGTPEYMAPEQIVGGQPIDGRTDLYAMGCVAYWLLTGRLVFEGRTVMDTILQHVRAAPVPPSRIAEVLVPPELEHAVLACLAKDAAQRPATADALADLLAAVPVVESWTPERARQWWDRYAASTAPSDTG